ncbi:hypothetical protein D3C73_799260 [compost metagenome]
MSLFADTRYKQLSRIGNHFDSRTALEVEFILSTVPYGYKKHLFAVEMKVGTKRVYIVKTYVNFWSVSNASNPTRLRANSAMILSFIVFLVQVMTSYNS